MIIRQAKICVFYRLKYGSPKLWIPRRTRKMSKGSSGSKGGTGKSGGDRGNAPAKK